MSPRRTIAVKAGIWQCKGAGAWHFITLPHDDADVIRELYGRDARGFGSLRVQAVIGDVAWDTSIFPDSTSDSYVLPIKKDIRKRCDLHEGDVAAITLHIL